MICTAVVLVRLRSPREIDPVSGIWTGDWGPTPSHRNAVIIAFRLDGTRLTGAVNPGPHALQFTKGTFEVQSGVVHFEVEVLAAAREVRYVIDGKVEGRTLLGTWYNADNKGNFRLIRK